MVCSIPELMVSLIREDVDFCLERPVVPFKWLRTFAGACTEWAPWRSSVAGDVFRVSSLSGE